MADDDTRRTAELDFIETLYGDPIRGGTVKAGRNLLVAGLLLVGIVKFGAELQSTSLFPLTFKRPDVLPTVLAVLVTLLLVNFLGRVLMDIGLFVEGERRIERFLWKAKLNAAVASAQEIDQDIDSAIERHQQEGPEDPDAWWGAVGKIREAAKAAEEAIENRLGRTTAVRLVRHLRAGGEVLVPIALALFSLALSSPRWQWPT